MDDGHGGGVKGRGNGLSGGVNRSILHQDDQNVLWGQNLLASHGDGICVLRDFTFFILF